MADKVTVEHFPYTYTEKLKTMGATVKGMKPEDMSENSFSVLINTVLGPAQRDGSLALWFTQLHVSSDRKFVLVIRGDATSSFGITESEYAKHKKDLLERIDHLNSILD